MKSLRGQSLPLIMGILNITPDSLWHGYRLGEALRHAETLVAEGAAILDIGGESTRPGATPISEQEECDRVLPVIESLRQTVDVQLSVDTSRPVVMKAALAAGVSFINDVRALQVEGALTVLANSQAQVCLMHMRKPPALMKNAEDYTKDDSPFYHDVVHEVYSFLAARLQACLDAGITRDRIVLDPGFGFDKSAKQNAALLNQLQVFTQLECRLLVGFSRKSFISAALGDISVDKRLPASLALSVLAMLNGATIIRTHDVKATAHAVHMASYVLREGEKDVEQESLLCQ